MPAAYASIEYRFFDSRFGECLIARSDSGICGLEFVNRSREAALHRLESDHPDATWIERDGALAVLVEEIFESGASARPELHLSGTDFQIAVWNSLNRIPVGATSTYQAVAESIGRPRAVRAVANAVASNRLAFLVPCHRVVRSDGALGGYRWGVELKSELLDWETAEHGGTRH